MCLGARSSVCGSSRELDGARSGARAPYCCGWLDDIIAYGPDLYAVRFTWSFGQLGSLVAGRWPGALCWLLVGKIMLSANYGRGVKM